MLTNGCATAGSPAQKQGVPWPCQLRWAMVVLLLYFGLRLLYFACTIAPTVPPDETTHFGICRIFAQFLLLPENSPASYAFGLVTNLPWLYYWLMGKLLWLNVFGLSDLLFLRLLNLPMAFATIYFAWRTLRLLTDERLSQLLLIVALTNTLMFTFLSASVSYDNLANLLATMAIFHLCVFFKARSAGSLGLSWLYQLAGCLTKSSLLPLLLILNLLLMVREVRNLRELPSLLTVQAKAAGWRAVALLMGIVAALALNVQLYGGNLLNYHKPVPEMRDVLPLEAVMQNRLAARDEIFIRFTEGRISYDAALAMTAQINHEGDRQAAIYLVNNYLQRRYSGEPLMSLPEYIFPWAKAMLASAYGIHGHLIMLNNGAALIPIIALASCAIIALLIRFRLREIAGLPAVLAAIALFYGLFLLYFFNYTTYQFYESFVLALQGRYVFPVIAPLYVLSSFYLLQVGIRERLRVITALTAACVFIASDFPFFLYHVTPDWFSVP